MDESTTVSLADQAYPALGKGYYDVIIFGIGFRECLIASLLIKEKKKVLILSKKQQFVWDNTSFDLLKLFSRFREEEPTDEDFEALGSNKDYHVDLSTRVIVRYGSMAHLLKTIGVYDKLDLKNIDLHLAFTGKYKKVSKLPSSPEEASHSSLLSMIQKMRCKSLLQSVQDYSSRTSRSQSDPCITRSSSSKSFAANISMEDVFTKFGISEGSQGFLGHGLALYENDEYLEENAKDTYCRFRSYMNTINSTNSTPFVYPSGGKQAFCQVLQEFLQENSDYCDIMLKQTSKQLVFEDNHCCGIIVGNQAARAKAVIGDNTWFRDDRQKKVGKVIRSICILNHPIEGCEAGKSSVIGFYKKQLIKAGYKPHDSDINCICLSWKMNICPKETQKPEKELKVVIERLGPILERFDAVSTLYKPRKKTKEQGIYIFKSPNASISLDSVADDVLAIYHDIVDDMKNV